MKHGAVKGNGISHVGKLSRMSTSSGVSLRGGSGLGKAIPSVHPEPNFGRVIGLITLVLNLLCLYWLTQGYVSKDVVYCLVPGVLMTSIFWRRNKVLVSLLCLLLGLTVFMGFTV